MSRKGFALLIGLLVLVAMVTMAMAQPGASSAPSGQVELELVVEMPRSPDGTPAGDLAEIIRNLGSSGLGGFQVDSFFDVSYVSNIGSNGLDGFQVDSFFDITYEIDFDSSPGAIEVEIVAMQLRGTLADPTDPAAALDAVIQAISVAKGKVYAGHITVLK